MTTDAEEMWSHPGLWFMHHCGTYKHFLPQNVVPTFLFWTYQTLIMTKCTVRRFYYHLPMKLWEGHVFSHVCLSAFLSTGGPHVTITHDALDLNIQGPTPSQLPLCGNPPALVPTPPGSGSWWPRPETCSNVFTWGTLAADTWWLATKACIVGERAIRILLECFLVAHNFWRSSNVIFRNMPQKTCKNILSGLDFTGIHKNLQVFQTVDQSGILLVLMYLIGIFKTGCDDETMNVFRKSTCDTNMRYTQYKLLKICNGNPCIAIIVKCETEGSLLTIVNKISVIAISLPMHSINTGCDI